MMEDFAVLETGGKQYKVSKDQEFYVEKLNGNVGDTVDIAKVLMLQKSDSEVVYNSGKVVLEILEQIRDKKIIVFKKRRRQNYRRKAGHRQSISKVKVKDIVA